MKYLDKLSPIIIRDSTIGHCTELDVDMRFGAGPRLIVGATDGRLIVGGTAGSPDSVACDVDKG